MYYEDIPVLPAGGGVFPLGSRKLNNVHTTSVKKKSNNRRAEGVYPNLYVSKYDYIITNLTVQTALVLFCSRLKQTHTHVCCKNHLCVWISSEEEC